VTKLNTPGASRFAITTCTQAEFEAELEKERDLEGRHLYVRKLPRELHQLQEIVDLMLDLAKEESYTKVA
jgi:hypothetical protein